MKISGAATFLLVGITTIFGLEEKHWIDYRLVSNGTFSLQTSTLTRGVTCNTAGKVCDDDCKRIWVCANNNGVLLPGLIETCTGDQTCNAGVCSATPTPQCSPAAQKPFVCQTEGVFPDPITCKSYHYCIEVKPGEFEDHKRSCTEEYSYNAGTTYCDKKLTNDHCGADYPVPICTIPGQHSALKDNKSLYYVCSIYGNTGDVLYPYLFLCPHGQTYDSQYGCK